jgi:hypothetical protein
MTDKFCRDCRWFRNNAKLQRRLSYWGNFIPSSNWCVNSNNTSKDMVNGDDIYKHSPSFLRDGLDEGKCGADGKWFEKIPELQNQLKDK